MRLLETHSFLTSVRTLKNHINFPELKKLFVAEHSDLCTLWPMTISEISIMKDLLWVACDVPMLQTILLILALIAMMVAICRHDAYTVHNFTEVEIHRIIDFDYRVDAKCPDFEQRHRLFCASSLKGLIDVEIASAWNHAPHLIEHMQKYAQMICQLLRSFHFILVTVYFFF